jgi:hypothetical protein
MLLVLRRFWVQITSDRKRFSVLCAMLALGMLLWGRIILTSNLPRTAVAGEDDPFLHNSGVRNGGAIGSSDKPRPPAVPVMLARSPHRDPFTISAEHFPKPTPVEVLGQDDPKFGPDATENTDRDEKRLMQRLRAHVSRFKLEAVMQGRPMAVINGKMYQRFSWIPAMGNEEIRFQLVEVGYRSVVLDYEGRRFKLKMDFPGNEER